MKCYCSAGLLRNSCSYWSLHKWKLQWGCSTSHWFHRHQHWEASGRGDGPRHNHYQPSEQATSSRWHPSYRKLKVDQSICIYPAYLPIQIFFTLTRFCPCRSIFIWKPKNDIDPTEERTSQKVKEYVYGSGSRKKPNGKHDNSSDDDSDGGGGKGKKAKKTRFTHTAKGKGKSKAWW